MNPHEAQNEATTIQTATPTLSEKKPRKYNCKPTPRQRRSAQLIVDSAMGKAPHIKNAGDIVIHAGYAPSIKKSPHDVLNTTGVDSALMELGFSPENAKRVVAKILNSDNSKDIDRLKASDMVFKVHGTYAESRSISVNIDVDATSPRLLEIAERLRGAI